MQHPHYIALFSSMASMHAVSLRANRAGSFCIRTSHSGRARRRARSRCTNSSHGYAVSSARVGGPANNTGLVFLTSESTIPKWWASRFCKPLPPPLCAFFWRNHANQCKPMQTTKAISRLARSWESNRAKEERRPTWLTGLTRVGTPRGDSSGWQTHQKTYFQLRITHPRRGRLFLTKQVIKGITSLLPTQL